MEALDGQLPPINSAGYIIQVSSHRYKSAFISLRFLIHIIQTVTNYQY